MTTFKNGDRVTVSKADPHFVLGWTKGLTGTVVYDKPFSTLDADILIEFSAEDAKEQGHNDKGGKGDRRWWIKPKDLTKVEDSDVLTLGTPEFTTSHFRAGSQASHILAHLLSGKSITKGECRLVYGDWQLADIIMKIRRAGFEVNTAIKQDAAGHDYVSYALAAKAA